MSSFARYGMVRRPPASTKKPRKSSKSARPDWNDYLTDGAVYQLNEKVQTTTVEALTEA